MKKYIFIAILFFFSINIFAQDDANSEVTKVEEQKEVMTIQPTIMAIPFTSKNYSIRSAYESNELVRIAITKVKEAFDQRGINTIDFRAKLKQLNNNEILTEDQQKTIKDDVIGLSGADIYVEVEANKNVSKSGNSVNVIMTAFDAFSGESLANKVASSPKFYTEEYEKLVEKAVEKEADNLLNTIQEKFNDIIENGRTVVVQLGIGEEASFDLDSEFGNDGYLLSEIIEEWMSENAYKGNFHMQGTTEARMIFDIVKIPLKDDKGKNYRLSKFGIKLRKYIESLGDINVDRTVNGNTLIITLNDPS